MIFLLIGLYIWHTYGENLLGEMCNSFYRRVNSFFDLFSIEDVTWFIFRHDGGRELDVSSLNFVKIDWLFTVS